MCGIRFGLHLISRFAFPKVRAMSVVISSSRGDLGLLRGLGNTCSCFREKFKCEWTQKFGIGVTSDRYIIRKKYALINVGRCILPSFIGRNKRNAKRKTPCIHITSLLFRQPGIGLKAL